MQTDRQACAGWSDPALVTKQRKVHDMQKIIIVVVIFVLLALAILFICREWRLQGRLRWALCRLPQKCAESEKKKE